MFVMQKEQMEHGIEDHEVRDDNDVWVGFRLGEATMWHIKLPLLKGVCLLGGEVG